MNVNYYRPTTGKQGHGDSNPGLMAENHLS